MIINGKSVSGIKAAVGDANHECADRWAILLNLDSRKVWETGLIGQDWLECSWPTIQIAEGHARSIFGREMASMAGIKELVETALGLYEHAKDAYARGDRYEYAPDDSEEDYCQRYVCEMLNY